MKPEKSKVYLITGAASGIGAATAKLAVSLGHRVVVADINDAGAKAVAARLGPAATAMHLDICAEAQWSAVLDEVWARFGRLDVLINNAAVVHTGYARDVPVAKHEWTMATNFMGPLTGMLAALPRFKAQGSGHLVTVCSMTAFLPFPGIASYAAAKHALRAFHHAVALEERDAPVAFSIIHPTSTETPMLDKEAEDDAMSLAFAGPSVTPDHVAEVILKAVKAKTVEVFMPPERGRVVRLVGTNPRSLRKLVERNEIVGRERLAARRAAVLAKAGNSSPVRQD
ncbi:MAG: SDR family oxidoreductase [Rhizobiales bacterium]|nr:SDR family oxidoreductase [Hyphomicrobiales bacterium]